jgi:hypothetical protein
LPRSHQKRREFGVFKYRQIEPKRQEPIVVCCMVESSKRCAIDGSENHRSIFPALTCDIFRSLFRLMRYSRILPINRSCYHFFGIVSLIFLFVVEKSLSSVVGVFNCREPLFRPADRPVSLSITRALSPTYSVRHESACRD